MYASSFSAHLVREMCVRVGAKATQVIEMHIDFVHGPVPDCCRGRA
jgi:hypothetical protein